MADYKVAIMETYRRVVVVKASSEKEARCRAVDAWKNGEIVMGDENFEGVEAYVLDEEADTDSDKSITRIDKKGIGYGDA